MKINGVKIANTIIKQAKNELKKTKLKPKLVVFSVKPTQQDLSYIKAKKKACQKIKARFELILYKKTPRFEEFAKKIKLTATDPKVNAIIIQKPLPASLNSVTVHDYIPDNKEIEGNKKKPLFFPPIALAVLTVIKSGYFKSLKGVDVIVNLPQDINLFKNIFKKRTIVILGRGETGGKPIGDTLSKFKINYISINSKTPSPQRFIKQADFLISAVGKNIVEPDDIKKGAFLISVGIRKDQNKYLGDYPEKLVRNIVSFYTPTPGGIGPVDISYLIHNLVIATKLQLHQE